MRGCRINKLRYAGNIQYKLHLKNKPDNGEAQQHKLKRAKISINKTVMIIDPSRNNLVELISMVGYEGRKVELRPITNNDGCEKEIRGRLTRPSCL